MGIMPKKEVLILSALFVLLLGFIFGYTAILTGQLSGFATLADYPNIFSGELVGVYGDNANIEEVVCLSRILAAIKPMQDASLPEVAFSQPGEKRDAVPIGNMLTDAGFFDYRFDANELTGFQDTRVILKGGSYDIHDELIIGKVASASIDTSVSPKVVTSLISNDDDYESGVYLEFKESSVNYFYVFDEAINLNDSSLSAPLKINFLGKELVITEIVSASEFKAYIADNYNMAAGESVSTDGKKVTLVNVGQNAIVVDVGGVRETISKGDTALVNGIQISVIELFYRAELEESSAVLSIGTSSMPSAENIKDGTGYIGGDGHCDSTADDPDCWKWVVNGLTTNSAGDIYTGNGPTIGIKSGFRMEDAKENPLGVGDCLDLPNRYASICFNSLTVSDTDYQRYLIYLDGEKIVIEAGSSGGLKASNNKLTRKIELQFNSSSIDILYETNENQIDLSSTITPSETSCTKIGEIHYGSTQGNDIVLCLQGTTSSSNNLNLTLDISGKEGFVKTDGNDDLMIGLRHSTSGFNGLRKLWWTNRDITSKDEDHRTVYGIVVRDPESGISSDDLELEIPGDQVEANIVIKGMISGLTQTIQTGEVLAGPMIKASEFDSEEYSGKNLVIVGTPDNNLFVERVLGGWIYGYNKAVIALKGNNLIVAGTTSASTLRACDVLKEYKTYAGILRGGEVVV